MSYCINQEWQRHAARAIDIPSGCRPYLAGFRRGATSRVEHNGRRTCLLANVAAPASIETRGLVDNYPRLIPPFSGSDHIDRRKGKYLVTVKRCAGLTATRGFGLLNFSRCVQHA